MSTQPQSQPSSPLSTKFKSHIIDHSQIVPLGDARRTTALHPSISNIKLPSPSENGNSLNPVTLKPFTVDDLKHHNYHALRREYATSDAAKRARDEAVSELKNRLDEMERRTREVEREMEEKEKTREIERKVWMKRRGEGAG